MYTLYTHCNVLYDIIFFEYLGNHSRSYLYKFIIASEICDII